jgi:hypothetical protein
VLAYSTSGQDIVAPPGFKVSVFASGLNMPTGIAFHGNKNKFDVYVRESGHGLPSRCNEQDSFPGAAATRRLAKRPGNLFTTLVEHKDVGREPGSHC